MSWGKLKARKQPKANSPDTAALLGNKRTLEGREISLSDAVLVSYYLGYENTSLIPYQMKLTRKQIREGLESMPVDRLLLGAGAHGVSLTKKQKAFAEEVVKTGNKSAAYRKAYDHKGKPQTAARDAQKVANNPKVSTYITALEEAERARAYLVPARLRDLAIHKITEKALDPSVPPAQQLKALELLGKITEVSLFTHRTETIHLTSSDDIKQQLMKSLRLALSGTITDVEAKPVDDLLAEIARGNDAVTVVTQPDPEVMYDDGALDDGSETLAPSTNTNPADPPHPDPQNQPIPIPPQLHSIPHIGSPSDSENRISSLESKVTVTGVTVTQGKPLEGEGV